MIEKTRQATVFLLPQDGILKLNFQTYHFTERSAVFIPKGQYVEAKSNQHLIVEDKCTHVYRFLFSQVLTVGHVFADNTLLHKDQNETLQISLERWLLMNPFNASQEELSMLFDLNEWLDHNISAKMESPNTFLSYQDIQRISREKLHLTFFQWKNHKLVNKARQLLFETSGSVKETAYELGFQDPSYFSRFFKNHTKLTPGQFAEGVESVSRSEALAGEFQQALMENINHSHKVSFYADLLGETPKTLSRNIQQSTGLTPKEHIVRVLISKANNRLIEGETVTSVAFGLGFEEVSHFSAFYKLHTSQNPSLFSQKSTGL